MRTWVVGLAAVGLLTGVMPQAFAEPVPPDQLVRETAEATLAEIRQRGAELEKTPEALYKLVEERLLPNFDINLISRQVLGRHWSQASPEQRIRFTVAFQRMLIRTYGKALLAFKDGEFEWLPLELSADAAEATVRSGVTHENVRLSVQYRMRLADEHWRVYDITIDGVSLVTNYRGIFNSEIRRSNVEDVILRLEQKVAS